MKKALTIFTFSIAAAMAQKPAPIDPEAAHLLSKTEAEQKAFINSAFDQGLPLASVNTVTSLIRERSATLAPVLGARVEAAMKSASPIDCFADKTVDPQAAIMAAATAIAYAANDNALKELSKILAIDDRRFGWLVGYALSDGGSRNFFPVAYGGYEIGSAPLDSRMTAWIEKQLQSDAEAAQPQLAAWWADALVDKLGRAPNESDWAADPIVKRLKPDTTRPLRDEVLRLAGTEAQRRTEH